MEAENAIATLAQLGFEVGDLRRQAAWEEWADQLALPNEIEKKFGVDKTNYVAIQAEVPVLSTSTLKVGRQVALTPGQREVLRSKYGMTPTKAVVVVEVRHYAAPFRDIVREVVIESQTHDPHRTRILKLCRIVRFGEFLLRARDAEKETKQKPQATKTTKQKEADAVTEKLMAKYC